MDTLTPVLHVVLIFAVVYVGASVVSVARSLQMLQLTISPPNVPILQFQVEALIKELALIRRGIIPTFEEYDKEREHRVASDQVMGDHQVPYPPHVPVSHLALIGRDLAEVKVEISAIGRLLDRLNPSE